MNHESVSFEHTTVDPPQAKARRASRRQPPNRDRTRLDSLVLHIAWGQGTTACKTQGKKPLKRVLAL